MFKKLFAVAVVALLFVAATYDEGMFPLSEIEGINLKKAGLKIKTKDIYNPSGTSLVDALVRVGGCTGSFVSDEGLIITNHHCAFSSAAGASSVENDYVTNGFLAETREKEIRTPLTCRITQSYMDVSLLVLDGVDKAANANERAEIIRKNIAKVTQDETRANPGMEIEVSEMLTGKTYTLFRYAVIKDVRLVYIPPRCIGEFGGESDNWVWPRHNGDFAFLRAYVGADGKGAEYSAGNVPYKPKKHLAVNPKGIQENDFVFVLGYPGRTYRHMPSNFLEYQYNYQLPLTSDWYDYQIEQIKQLGEDDRAVAIALSSREKSLANVTKNYKGKLQGLSRTTIIADKKAEEEAIKKMISADPKLTQQYGNLFSDIDKVYKTISQTAKRDYYLGELFNGSAAFYMASFIAYHGSVYNSLQGKEKEDYLKTMSAQRKLLEKYYVVRYKPLDMKLLEKLLAYMWELPADQKPDALKNFFTDKNYEEEIHALVENADKNSHLWDQKEIMATFDSNPAKLLNMKDPMITLAGELYQIYADNMQQDEIRRNQLTALFAQLTEVRMQYKKTGFIPDANSTLRFTYGHVKGYWPNDGVYNKPFTTVKGILEKAEDQGDYYLKSDLKRIMQTAKAESIVCFLYDLDTTGGNSGSPIMDASGNLVGVNFDRAFTACINDYAWNEEYSRSIGVDIRYVLYVLKDIAHANYLVKEMGVS